MESLRRWGDPSMDANEVDRVLHRQHVKAHVEAAGHWGQNMNEVTDILANLGKTLVIDNLIDPWICLKYPHQKSVEEISVALLGPTNADEMRAALSYGSSVAQDTAGLSGGLLRNAGDALVGKMVEKWNEAAYQGKMPIYSIDGLIVGRHRAIGKSGGG